MATIQAGTTETFKSLTAEGRLIETVCFMRLAELDTAKNPDELNSVLGDFSITDMAFTGTYNIPCSQSLTGTGALSIVANAYLLNTGFTPGTGTPTFKSAAIEGYLLEVLSYLQALEADVSKNPTGVNNIAGTFNSDTNVYSGSFVIPVQLSLDTTGKSTFTAVEYLQA